MQHDFTQLKRNSICLKMDEEIEVIRPGEQEPSSLKASNMAAGIKDGKSYAYNGKSIAFISDGNYYITPFSKEAMEIVRNAGYKLRETYAPFSRGEKPTGKTGAQWNELIAARSPKRKQAAAASQPLQLIVATA